MQEPEQACEEADWKQQAEYAAQNVAQGTLTPYGYKSGIIGAAPMDEAEMRKRQREATAQQAIYILEQARQIRADAALMTDVRAHIRKLRDDGAALLDDIGG